MLLLNTVSWTTNPPPPMSTQGKEVSLELTHCLLLQDDCFEHYLLDNQPPHWSSATLQRRTKNWASLTSAISSRLILPSWSWSRTATKLRVLASQLAPLRALRAASSCSVVMVSCLQSQWERADGARGSEHSALACCLQLMLASPTLSNTLTFYQVA